MNTAAKGTPIHRHASDTVKSGNDAGGIVDKARYDKPPPPQPAPPRNLSETDEADPGF